MAFVVMVTSDSENVWIQGLLLSMGLHLMVLLMMFPLIACGVHPAAIKSYGTFRTIQMGQWSSLRSAAESEIKVTDR